MQNWPLTTSSVLRHASTVHGHREIVTNTVEGGLHRYTYHELGERSRKLAYALQSRLNLRKGDVVGSMAWNTYRHLEIWYALMGMGMVCHTLNPRLFLEQLQYIIRHGDDVVIFFDLSFMEIVEKLARKGIRTVKKFVVMTDRAHMPSSSLKGLLCYEDLMTVNVPQRFTWENISEDDAAGLCYTSGTTGNPKGVLYSHRSNILHGMICALPDAFGIGCADCVMPAVPMFHANSWGLAFGCLMAGCKIALPGPHLEGKAVYELLENEQVTVTAAVPTVWMMLKEYMLEKSLNLSSVKRILVGGAAMPPSLMDTYEGSFGTEMRHAWGMTEMSPIGTVNPGPAKGTTTKEETRKIKLKQGLPIYTVELRIVDDGGNVMPKDGETFGHLQARGASVLDHYYKKPKGSALTKDGWFDTGDVATLDSEGYMQITDRSKDVIKSGGEWISSIEVENQAMRHPDVSEAAVVGVYHEKWTERPLLIVVKRQGSHVTEKDILAFMRGKVAKWWIPDACVFVDEIPHTATGKMQKLRLRQTFKDYYKDILKSKL